MKVIPYGRQDISKEDISTVIETLQSDFLTQGPKVAEFEQAFAEYVGCQFAIAVSNGTAALHLCAVALNVSEKSNVITSPITFAASANCIKYCGGNVYFADINPETYCLDIGEVRQLIESKPKGFFSGIIPVDFAGFALNMQAFRELADEHGLWVIEDSCHAPGGWFRKNGGLLANCGNGEFADLAIFSFHPVKHITCGEGGMITTNNKKLYEKLLMLRTHGITKDPSLMVENHGDWYYEMQMLGYNYRLTDFQAALGISQLKRAGEGVNKRIEIAVRYNEAFKRSAFVKGQSGIIEGHAYHLYVIQVTDRKGLYVYLRSHGIFCQVHYIPVHTLPYYKTFGFKQGDFPLSESYYQSCLSLPMFPTLSIEDQDFVITSIHKYFS